MASFSSGVSGHLVLGVTKCVGVRQTGHVRIAYREAANVDKYPTVVI